MDIGYIDYLSNREDISLNRCSALSKIIMAILVIASVLMINDLTAAGIIAVIIFAETRFTGMPLTKMAYFLIYPLVFSLPFAILRAYYDAVEGILIIFKSVGVASVLLIIISSTSYIQLFSFFRLFLPGIIVDSMFFTYRIIFILIDKIANIISMLKLRGGWRPSNLLFNIRNLAGALGILFINTFDMADRMYDIYSLRGYEGNLHFQGLWYKLRKIDVIPVLFGLSAVFTAVLFRLWL